MREYTPLHGQAFIRVKKTVDDRTESGIYKDITYNQHGKTAICAEVIAAADRGTPNEVLLEVVDGWPRSREKEPNYLRSSDIKYDIQKGDRVYFHYLTLEDDHNFVSIDGDWKIYKVDFSSIFLSMRPSKTGKYLYNDIPHAPVLHNQYVLGEPFWGWDWEEIEVEGKMVGAKMNDFGLVTETRDKPIENACVITDIGFGIKPYSRHGEVQPGDVVMLKPSCEFVNEIEGQERWVFTHQDIMAIYETEKSYRPVCNNTLIKLKEREYKGNLEVDITKLPLETEGEIVSMGDQVDDVLQVGDMVKFAPKRTRSVEDKYAIVEEHDIVGVMKYSL